MVQGNFGCPLDATLPHSLISFSAALFIFSSTGEGVKLGVLNIVKKSEHRFSMILNYAHSYVTMNMICSENSRRHIRNVQAEQLGMVKRIQIGQRALKASKGQIHWLNLKLHKINWLQKYSYYV